MTITSSPLPWYFRVPSITTNTALHHSYCTHGITVEFSPFPWYYHIPHYHVILRLWTLRLRDTSFTKQFAYILDSSPTAHFGYGHHKNTYPAIHMAAISKVITQFLLYIV